MFQWFNECPSQSTTAVLMDIWIQFSDLNGPNQSPHEVAFGEEFIYSTEKK